MTREDGFTLLEVLAAVAVFALVSAISVGLLTTALRGKAQTEAALARIDTAQRVGALFTADMGQIVMRPARTGEGLEDPRVFAADARGTELVRGGGEAMREVLVFTRTGWANPGANQPRSTLQRVVWLYDGDALWREAYAYPDAARGADPRRRLMADGVSDLQVEVFGGAGWLNQARIGPSGAAGAGAAAPPPAAVRLRYTLAGVGALEHVALTPGAGAIP
ncbi:type II secretion system minor pseudopilin GspJ [Maricaulaceae bacterium MS644]